MATKSRWRKRNSDRSGFTHRERELVLNEGVLVAPDEFDAPPPSKKSLGGEGDISPGDTRVDSDTYTTPSDLDLPVYYITAADGITFNERIYRSSGEQTNYGYLRVAGSNGNIDVTANPQVSASRHGVQLTIECVGSSIILEDGSGLSLRSVFNMDSGSILNLFYSETTNLWQETSRSHRTKVV